MINQLLKNEELIRILKEEKIFCETEWIIYGTLYSSVMKEFGENEFFKNIQSYEKFKFWDCSTPQDFMKLLKTVITNNYLKILQNFWTLIDENEKIDLKNKSKNNNKKIIVNEFLNDYKSKNPKMWSDHNDLIKFLDLINENLYKSFPNFIAPTLFNNQNWDNQSLSPFDNKDAIRYLDNGLNDMISSNLI
jgi:hypothetical protein